jgi:hypothetical protein
MALGDTTMNSITVIRNILENRYNFYITTPLDRHYT